MSALVETKFLAAADCALSLKSEGDRPVVVEGYASTFGGEPDSYGDVIAPGAYARTIRVWGSRTHSLPMLLQHGETVIGKWTQLREDHKGLWVSGELTPGHSAAADVAASLRHGALSGLSIGFRCKKFSLDPKASVRTLEDIDLHEISAVANPACETARVEAVKAALLDAERRAAENADVTAAVGHIRRARAALDPHVPDTEADGKALLNGEKAGNPMAAIRVAHDACGSAMTALGAKPAKTMQLRELRDFLREEFGVSRREAEETAERLIKARDAGDGIGRGGAGDGGRGEAGGRSGDTHPGDGNAGADLLAAIMAARTSLPSWVRR